MARYVKAKINSVSSVGKDLQRGLAELAGKKEPRPFISYRSLTGNVKKNDEVLLNTVAIDLSLGTGGHDIVVANLSRPQKPDGSGGHIIKLRYTPVQTGFSCLEEDPRYKRIFNSHPADLKNAPVVVCEVLSQTAPVAAMIKALVPKAKIALIVTDGAALPLQIADLVREMRERTLIDLTITCGQAFGGDHECVNIYSALLGAVKALKADIVIVSVGPGIIGTGTFYGHGAFEQAESLTAASRLKATAIGVLRASLKDKRERHRGISHHSVAVLEATARENIVWPYPSGESHTKQLETSSVSENSKIIKKLTTEIHHLGGSRLQKVVPKVAVETVFKSSGIAPETMGRGYEDDPIFFELAASAGAYAAKMLLGQGSDAISKGGSPK